MGVFGQTVVGLAPKTAFVITGYNLVPTLVLQPSIVVNSTQTESPGLGLFTTMFWRIFILQIFLEISLAL